MIIIWFARLVLLFSSNDTHNELHDQVQVTRTYADLSKSNLLQFTQIHAQSEYRDIYGYMQSTIQFGAYTDSGTALQWKNSLRDISSNIN